MRFASADAIALLRGRRSFSDALDGVARLISRREGTHVDSTMLRASLESRSAEQVSQDEVNRIVDEIIAART